MSAFADQWNELAERPFPKDLNKQVAFDLFTIGCQIILAEYLHWLYSDLDAADIVVQLKKLSEQYEQEITTFEKELGITEDS
jgi:hypothetical protein